MLIAPFFSLFIESYRVEQVVNLKISRKFKKKKFLLNDEIYISATHVVKKK